MLDVPHSTIISRLLDEVTTVREQSDDELVNTKRKGTLDTIRSYTIKSAIFNLARHKEDNPCQRIDEAPF
jgi:hypothetical protein